MATRKPKAKVGDVLKIDLEDGSFSYARVLKNPLMAFYDLRTNAGADVDIRDILSAKILFKIWVMNNAVTSGRWTIIGNVSLEQELKVQPKFFKEDQIAGTISIYRDDDGSETPTTWDECKDFECAAAWSANHVEDRLRDLYKGVPCRWVELLKPKAQRRPFGNLSR